MIKLISLFLITISLNASMWITYKEAYEIKDIVNKKAIVIIGSENCHYCEKLLNDIESNNDIRNIINNNFIPIYLDKDKDFIPIDLYSTLTPTVYILSNDLNHILFKSYGYKDIDSFKKILKETKYVK